MAKKVGNISLLDGAKVKAKQKERIVNVRLDVDQYDRLESICSSKDITISEAIRTLVKKLIEESEK